MENKGRKAVRVLLLVGLTVCLIPVGQTYGQSVQHWAQKEELREMIKEEAEQNSVRKDSAPQEISVSAPPKQAGGAREISAGALSEQAAADTDGGLAAEKPVMLHKYVDLYEENKDLVGWLTIDGMKIDYPVMQNEDDEYYLHRDFYGNDSKYGCLYVREQADLDAGTNFIIYGHNMKDGAMFGELDLYLKESFYKEHPAISFDTLYEERAYDIIAVFRSQVYKADDEVFKYYQFYEAKTREEFADFYGNIKALSLYDTGVEAEFGDTFLTLSTCAYHVKDGRLVVVAKRVR